MRGMLVGAAILCSLLSTPMLDLSLAPLYRSDGCSVLTAMYLLPTNNAVVCSDLVQLQQYHPHRFCGLCFKAHDTLQHAATSNVLYSELEGSDYVSGLSGITEYS